VVLWGVASFVVLQLVLTLAREGWLPELRDPPFGAKIKYLAKRTRQAPNPPTTVVMLGSSRTAFGFRAKLLEAPLTQAQRWPVVVFNFGIYGAGPVSQLLYLNELLARGIRPDLLLIEVAPMFLDDQSEREEISRLPADRLGRRDLAVVERYRGPPNVGLRADWWRAAAVPVYAHRIVILSELLPVLLPRYLRIECCRTIDDSGWLRLQLAARYLTPEGRQGRRESVRAELAPALGRLRTDGKGIQALRELLTLARRKGISAALILMPEGPYFRESYPPGSWQCVCSLMESLHREFGCPLINCREWIAEEGFVDSHHLLPEGAAVFTERLGREAILPLLESRQAAASLSLNR
jgi:hypothetical protein